MKPPIEIFSFYLFVLESAHLMKWRLNIYKVVQKYLSKQATTLYSNQYQQKSAYFHQFLGATRKESDKETSTIQKLVMLVQNVTLIGRKAHRMKGIWAKQVRDDSQFRSSTNLVTWV